MENNKSNIKKQLTPELKEIIHKIMIPIAEYNWRNYWVPYLKEQEKHDA